MILVEKNNHIETITLNRSDKSNAFTSEMIEVFIKELKRADQDSDVRVIIITGAGKHFCAGGDVKMMQNKEGMFEGEPNQLRELYTRGIQQIPMTFNQINTPTIAMINGAAIGAGLDLSCMCDIRIASDKAKFGETFTSLGLIAGDGGSYYLQRVIGFARAMELSLTSEIINADRAKEIGLVSYSGADYKEVTNNYADKIASNPPIATQMMKRAIEDAYHSDILSHLNLVSSYQGITQRTEDHFKAIERLLTKKSTSFEHK